MTSLIVPAGSAILRKCVMLGLGAAAPIGPVNVEIARRTLRGGFWAGFALGCGAVTVDVLYCVLSTWSLGPLVQRPAIGTPIAVAGFLFLGYLGLMSLKSVGRHLAADPLSGAPRASAAGAYATGVAMTLLNPMTLAFWFLSMGAITKDLWHDLPMICTGVFIGTIGWVIAFCGILGFLGRWRKNWWLAAADGLGGAMLLFLAALGLWHLWRQHL